MAVESATALVPAGSGEAPTVVGGHPDRGPRVSKTGPREGNDALMVRLWWLVLTAAWLLASIFSVTLATRGADGTLAVSSPEASIDLGWLTPVVFPESAALQLQQSLPAGPVFALAFWLVPVLILALLPAALVEFRVPFPAALGASLLVVITPLFAWGSLASLNALLPAVVAISLWAFAARTKRRWSAALLAILVGIAAARLPWSEPAMAVPVAIALVVIAFTFVLSTRARLVRLMWVVPLSAAVTAGLWWLIARTQGVSFAGLFPATPTRADGSDLLVAANNVGLPRAFGAPFEVLLPEGSTADTALAGELKGTWSFLVVALAALTLGYLVRGSWGERARALITALITAAGFAWFLLDRSDVAVPQVPMFDQLEPFQVAAIWGTVVIVALAVLFGAPRHWVFSTLTLLGTAALLGATALAIRADLLPELDRVAVVAVIAVASLGAWLMARRSAVAQYLGLAVAIAGAVAVVWPMVGFEVG